MDLKSLATVSLIALASATALRAEDAHHPQTAAEPAAPTVAAPVGPADMGMMAMMPDMMRMMQGMGDPTRHVEGRIAFLRAELAITAGQEAVWSALADALRLNATRLTEAAAAGNGHGANSGVTDKLIMQQRQLEARLDGLRAINAALAPLAAALSDNQRRALDDLFPHAIGMMGMGGMMQMSGMPPAAPAENLPQP